MPMFIAAGIGAVGQIAGGLIGANAASAAANATGQASQQAIQQQALQFGIGQQNQQPWLTTGGSALTKLAGLYGLDTYTPAPPNTAGSTLAAATSGPAGGLQYANQGSRGQTPLQDIRAAQALGRPITDAQWAQAGLPPGGGAYATGNPTGAAPTGAGGAPGGTFTPGSSQPGVDPNATFYQSPDYQFQLSQGIKGTDAAAAARGQLDSGGTRKAEITSAGNLANGNFNQYANRLSALAGVGQTTATNEAGQGQTYANNVGNIAVNQGENNANAGLFGASSYAGTIGKLAGIGSGLFANNNSYTNATGGNYNGSYMAPFNSAAAAQGY